MKRQLSQLIICVMMFVGLFSCTRPAEIEVSSVTISQPEAELTEGENLQLKAWALPEEAIDKTLTWSSTKPSVASVSQDGLVTALAYGSTKIIATSVNGKTAICTVWVSKRIVEVESITLDKTEVALLAGETASLKATVTPDNATYEYIVWTSSNREVATVDNDGVITAVGGGEATITAKVAGKSAACQVTVGTPVSSVSLDITAITLVPGENYNLSATVSPANATDKTVTWSSSDTDVVAVDQSGQVRAKSVGTATITATAGKCSATCLVTVLPPVENIILEQTSVNLKQGGTAQMAATIVPAAAAAVAIAWSSSDESVATVNQQGLVTAVAGGQTRITATAGSCTAVCVVQVIPLVTGIALSQTEAVLITGQSLTLTANILPVEASGTEISWSSSSTDLCSVDNGVVTAGNSTGSATITASADGVSATCSILVVRDSYTGVYASYIGGSIVSFNGIIQSGSKLSYRVTNYSSETINVVSVQLIDGVTGAKGNVMSLGKYIVPGDSSGWTITIGAAGIHSPIARFVYTFRGTQYTCDAQYSSFSF